jgi:preprotein translocase subunit SecD
MMYFSRLQTWLILGVCALGVLFSLPNVLPQPASWVPWRAIHLGLDLKGGSYLLLEVDMNAVIKERLDSMADSARQSLRRAGIPRFLVTVQHAQNRLTVRIEDTTRIAQAMPLLRELSTAQPGQRPDLEFEQTPEGLITITLSPIGLRERATAAVSQSIEIVRRRIDETGVVDPIITRQGEARIVVQLPGVEDPNRIKQLLGKTARMTFRLTDETANLSQAVPPPGVDFLTVEGRGGGRIAVRRRIEVDGANLTDARAGQDGRSGQWVVNFTFDSIGTRRFAEISRANVGRPFAIVLDDKVISAPVINEPIIGGRGQISGSFNAASANELAILLRAGALPAPLTVIEERTVGPELGADAIRAGAIALAVGFVLVLAYMVVMYGMFGLFANIALVANLVLLTAILSLMEATLTLPGMAGILLILGMAVDSNILINERIREEVRAGRSPLNALEHGYRLAMSTIIDSNATGFLSHIMLFTFGAGPVRGFAITITIGVFTSVFTSTMVARLMMAAWYARRRPAALPI